MDYQAAYMCLREAILRAQAVPGEQAKQILNEALDAAPTASDEPAIARCPDCGHALRGHSMGGICMVDGCSCERPSRARRGLRHTTVPKPTPYG